MRLTNATLAAFTKYPQDAMTTLSSTARFKKHGFYKLDNGTFARVANAVGLIRQGDNAWCRHPLAYLVEAADDICYRVLDMEDGFVLRHITFDEVDEALGTIVRSADKSFKHYHTTDIDRVGRLRAIAIGQLVKEVADAFLSSEAAILSGEFRDSLLDVIPSTDAAENIRKINASRCYMAPDVLHTEAGGFEVIARLLDKFVPAIVSNQPSKGMEKLRQLLPTDALSPRSHYEQVLRVLDFISAMTDSHAISTYRRVHGIALMR
jgi:dGTPase